MPNMKSLMPSPDKTNIVAIATGVRINDDDWSSVLVLTVLVVFGYFPLLRYKPTAWKISRL